MEKPESLTAHVRTGERVVTHRWEVLSDNEDRLYFGPVESHFTSDSAPDFSVEHRMFFDVAETIPDPLGLPGHHLLQKVLDLKDATLEVIESE
jgi:hypothetical protein